MLVAVFLTNAKGMYIARPLVETSKEKIARIVETFWYHQTRTEETKGVLETEIGDFFYQELDETYMLVFGDAEDALVAAGMKTLESGIRMITRDSLSLENYGEEMAEIVNIIDEIFTKDGVIPRTPDDISKIVRLHSSDEALHQILEKSKEKERSKMLKAKAKMPALDALVREIEEIKILREDLQTHHASPGSGEDGRTTRSPAGRTTVKHSARRLRSPLEDADRKINLFTHQKITASISQSNELLKSEGSGELHIKVTDPLLTHPAIRLSEKPGTARPHPSVDKKLFLSHIVQPKMDVPTDKILTLMKWSVTDLKMPFEVDFWQTEVSEDKYRFYIEISALQEIREMEVRVPVICVSDLEIENGKIKEDWISLERSNVSAEESLSLEFTGVCSDPEKIFPFSITYVTPSDTLLPLVVASVYVGSEDSMVPADEVFQVGITEGECLVVS